MDCESFEEEIQKIGTELGTDFQEDMAAKLVITREDFEEQRKLVKEGLGDGFKDEAIDCYVHRHAGLGRLTPFIFQDDLEEIMVIGQGVPVFIFHREKGMVRTDITMTEDEIKGIIYKVANYNGRRVGPESPLLDARLPDGSRVNATLQVVSPRGSSITIRRFETTPLNVLDLIRNGTLDLELSSFLWLVVDGMGVKPANIMVAGGTASGKTTTLNALSSFIPNTQRIVSIEDTLELAFEHENWIPLETKPPIPGAEKEVSMDDLLKNALRMRPDRIIVGEVRGEEALTLFSAMNTGHDGCMCTLHANSARDAITRVTTHPMNVPDIMFEAVDLIIAQKRYSKGGKSFRRVFQVAEVAGREADNILTNILFTYDNKTDQIDNAILNGRIIQTMAKLTGLSISEIDDEVSKREAILSTMLDHELTSGDIDRVIQGYYKDPDGAVDLLLDMVKDKTPVEKENPDTKENEDPDPGEKEASDN
jgi:flagellar protein FlaI